MKIFRAGSKYDGSTDLLLHGGLALIFALLVATACAGLGYLFFILGWATASEWPAVALIPAVILAGLDTMFMMWSLRITHSELHFTRLAGTRRIPYEDIQIITQGDFRDLYLSGWFLYYLGSSQSSLIKFSTYKGRAICFPIADRDGFLKTLDEMGYPHSLEPVGGSNKLSEPEEPLSDPKQPS